MDENQLLAEVALDGGVAALNLGFEHHHHGRSVEIAALRELVFVGHQIAGLKLHYSTFTKSRISYIRLVPIFGPVSQISPALNMTLPCP